MSSSRDLKLTAGNVSEQFALTEVSFVIVRMLQWFEKLESLDPGREISKVMNLTLVPRNGVKVRLFRGVKA